MSYLHVQRFEKVAAEMLRCSARWKDFGEGAVCWFRAIVYFLAFQSFVVGFEEWCNSHNTLCSVPITFLLVCNLGKLMLLHPAVKRMKYSFSLWYCSVSREGICICWWRLPHVPMLFSKASWAGWFPLLGRSGLRRGWSVPDLFQSVDTGLICSKGFAAEISSIFSCYCL